MSPEQLVERVRHDSDVQKAFAQVAMRVAMDQLATGVHGALAIGEDFMQCVPSNDTDRGEAAAMLILEILNAADRAKSA